MGVAELGAVVVAALGPYLSKAGEEFAKKIGEAGWSGIKALYDAVKNKLSGDELGSKALLHLAQEPESVTRQRILATVIDDAATSDPEFLRVLTEILVRVAPANPLKIEQRINVSGTARNITQIGSAGKVRLGDQGDN